MSFSLQYDEFRNLRTLHATLIFDTLKSFLCAPATVKRAFFKAIFVAFCWGVRDQTMNRYGVLQLPLGNQGIWSTPTSTGSPDTDTEAEFVASATENIEKNFSYYFHHCFICRPSKFHCADGCWDRNQDRSNWCIDSQTLDLIRNRLDLIRLG